MATLYFTVVLIVLIGCQLSARRSFWRVGAAALASSVLFYVVTNFGMWLFSGIYPRTLGGLEACYIAAIPFFQNTVAGDLVYTGLLFGGFALLKDAIPRLREARTQSRPDPLGCKIRPAAIKGPRSDLRPLVGNQQLTQGKLA